MALLEVGPWAYDRYVSKYEFSFISWETIKNNFKEGFHYDRDNFPVNQSSHPYHGSLFFDAGRSNGYTFWASSLFTLAGSLLWECCMENTAPSVNDLVNTTLGGMTRGAGVLSKYDIGSSLTGLTDATVFVFPLAGIRTTDFDNPETGRNYDYAPGGGTRLAGRVYYKGREIAGAGYGVAWGRTANGVSQNNTLQFFRAVARIPLVGPLGAGVGYSWYSRKTTYTRFFEARKTQSELRAFLNVAFAFR